MLQRKIDIDSNRVTVNNMDNSRELASLLRRANRIAILQAPPKLELAVVNDGDELPPPSPWRMNLVIEPKLPTS